jgi:hypothetical protein
VTDRFATAAAGAAYTLTWVVGLSVFSPSTTVTSPGSDLLRQYAGHERVLALQYLLTQGLAALLLAVVLAAVVRSVSGPAARVVRVAGGGAVCVSLVQCLLGLLLATVAVPDSDAAGIGALADTINRLDGLKMTLLAATWGCLAHAVRRREVGLPRRSVGLFAATSVALLASAAGYGFLYDRLATAAFVSLPLLLASATLAAAYVRPRYGDGLRPQSQQVRGDRRAA